MNQEKVNIQLLGPHAKNIISSRPETGSRYRGKCGRFGPRALSLRYPSFYITLRAVGVFGLAHGCEQ
jgi:hypothetical protein